jgi:small subunit ribosomal protein S8
MMAKGSNMTTDPIADMLTRIRNAMGARHSGCVVPHSQIKMEIAKILVTEGYLKSAALITGEDSYPAIKITFKGDMDCKNAPRVIQGLRRISKPGLRVYSGAADLPKVLNGLGIAIISTSKGIMTDKQAREQNLGGEVLAYVW